MTWPFNAEPAHGALPPLPRGVPRPAELEADYGAPTESVCREARAGVFERTWSRAGTVALDCNAFAATLGDVVVWASRAPLGLGGRHLSDGPRIHSIL